MGRRAPRGAPVYVALHDQFFDIKDKYGVLNVLIHGQALQQGLRRPSAGLQGRQRPYISDQGAYVSALTG